MPYTIHTSDTESAYEYFDGQIAAACDAAIADLPISQQCCLHHEYLDAVYRFEQQDYQDLLSTAKAGVRLGLIRRCVHVVDA